jgi:alpha-tubulin suppressor-like RCC1 family protein
MPGVAGMPNLRTVRRLLFLLVSVTLLALPGPAAAEAPPEAALTGIRRVTVGLEHSCALMANAQVRCWGGGSYGKLGNGAFDRALTPVTVVAVSGSGPLTNVTQVAAGYNHTCALLASRQVRCWGFNDGGQLGNNTGYSSFATPQVVLNDAGNRPLKNVIAIAVGGDTSCALLATHQVRCWGANGSGQAGTGLPGNAQLPKLVRNPAGTGPLQNVTQISVGWSTTCARLSNGQVRCWGYNNHGQVGDGTTGTDRRRPRVVRSVSGPGALTGVKQVAVGETVACALLNSGQVRCWGQGDDGGLGNGGLVDRNRPVRVALGPGQLLTGVTQIQAGYSSACARLGNGRVRCWGRGLRGEMGNGDFVEDNPRPVLVLNSAGTAPLTGITDLHYGESTGCVRLANGQARCWGLGMSAQLGNGIEADSASTVTVQA